MLHRRNTEIVSDKKVAIDQLYLTAIGLVEIKISDKNVLIAIHLLFVFEA